MIEQSFSESLEDRLAANETASSVYWLGQAGFAIATPELRIFVDPYFSDFLARKYAASRYSHARMMPPPLKPEKLMNLNYILCTHRHGDHMDPEGLPFLANQNPECRVIVPAAELSYAMELGLAEPQLIPADADKPITLHPDLRIHPIPAAHEAHKLNAAGSHHFLGYILELPTGVIYHSGDSVPYSGLIERLRRHQIELALLPVNGRNPALAGIAGNFSLTEAIDLCRMAHIPALVTHHFGMFPFNTLDPKEIDSAIRTEQEVQVYRAKLGVCWRQS
ncbi:MAG: MBL fold metallo-hydrolase [Verrucomicrobia bacterium]|nr:MBL fold metallo-hydrolase [Verrucomicrobiota bacterium]